MGLGYNMYHPQHYLLHELPSINENHCCDIIKANDSCKIIFYFIWFFFVMDTEELAGML